MNGVLNEKQNDGSRLSIAIRNTFSTTLIGAWPIDAERLKAYMVKATREAKQRTSG